MLPVRIYYRIIVTVVLLGCGKKKHRRDHRYTITGNIKCSRYFDDSIRMKRNSGDFRAKGNRKACQSEILLPIHILLFCRDIRKRKVCSSGIDNQIQGICR